MDRTAALITLCVAGVRKFTLRTPIVTTTENVTRIIVKSKYFPKKRKEMFDICVRETYCMGNILLTQ